MSARLHLRSRPSVIATLVVLTLFGRAASIAQSDRGRRDARADGAISPEVAADSHRRMLAALREIADRTDAENPWLGEGARDATRAALAEIERSGDDLPRLRALVHLAEEDLRVGDEQAAIDHFAAAYALLPGLAGKIPELEAAHTVFRLGVAH